MTSQEITLDGITVYLYRSLIDGRLVVDIDTTQAENPDVDHHEGNGVPKLRLWVNECEEELDEDGAWIRKPPIGGPQS